MMAEDGLRVELILEHGAWMVTVFWKLKHGMT